MTQKYFFHNQKPWFSEKKLFKKLSFLVLWPTAGGLVKVGELGKHSFRAQHYQITQKN